MFELLIEIVYWDKGRYGHMVKKTKHVGGSREAVNQRYHNARCNADVVYVDIVHERDLTNAQLEKVEKV